MSSRKSVSGANSLGDVSVLVTRPTRQAESLCHLIETRGGRVLRFPVLEIRDPPDTASLGTLYERLPDYDIAIFVSANAVRNMSKWVLNGRQWPSSVQIAAVGPSTVGELKIINLPTHLYPQRKFNSEGLLDLDEMHRINNKRIIVFRGTDGRELLGDTLRARGAILEYAEVYRRAMPEGKTNELKRYFESGGIDVITVSSLESLQNLIQMAGESGCLWLRETPIVVVNNAMAELVRQLGSEALQAENATDPAIIEALLRWSKDRS